MPDAPGILKYFYNFSIPNTGPIETAEPLKKVYGVLNPSFHHLLPEQSHSSYSSHPSLHSYIQKMGMITLIHKVAVRTK